MKNKKAFATIFVPTLLFAALTFHGMVTWHENQHKDIYKEHNCTHIKISYSYNLGTDYYALTEARCPNDGGEDEHERVHKIQKQVQWLWMIIVLFFELSLIQHLALRKQKTAFKQSLA